jgi:hypothetical protein
MRSAGLAGAGRGTTRRRVRSRRDWVTLSDSELLELRFCDLGLRLDEPRLVAAMKALHAELEARQVGFLPHFWLADEWFSPDGVPGLAIPFYLAHPRLAALERRQMHEVEGGNRRWLMRILRHEAGHAIDTAYGLRRRRDWREVFGKASQPYPTRYRPRPASHRFVLHLGLWYAQSHPTEDFAETFAVWLTPRSRWRRDYGGWPALKKLEFVDRTMRELRNRPARNAARSLVEPLEENVCTLREHYRRRLGRYPDGASRVYDRQLHRVFAQGSTEGGEPSAASYLRGARPRLRQALVKHAGIHPYLASHVLRTATERARVLKLKLKPTAMDLERAVLQMLERIILDTLLRDREDFAL